VSVYNEMTIATATWKNTCMITSFHQDRRCELITKIGDVMLSFHQDRRCDVIISPR